jgi:hypothetical protein
MPLEARSLRLFMMKYFVEDLKCGSIRPEQKRFSAPPYRLRVEDL